MTTSAAHRRVFLLCNPEKPAAAAALEALRAFATSRCSLVGAERGLDGRAAIKARADRLIVLGGDGTLIGVARSLSADPVPLIGVNVGKLGYLAEFSVEELKQCFERAVADDSLIHRRTVLQVEIFAGGAAREKCLAINDCVIQAGPPFRLIKLGVLIDGEHLTDVGGDGLIVCTPSGSTAHNLSAGGPILDPGVGAIVLTPLCAHSLTHKPLVVERESVIEIQSSHVNPGTTAIIDGQVSLSLRPSDRIRIRRFPHDAMLVANPLYPRRHNLIHKLHWGQGPGEEI